MSLSKDFIERGHNGTIGVESPGELGIGSTFYFCVTLPLVPPDQALPPTPFLPREKQKDPWQPSDSVVNLTLPSLLTDSSTVPSEPETQSGSDETRAVFVQPLVSTALEPIVSADDICIVVPPAAFVDPEKPPLRVLVVDDSVVTCKLMCKALVKLGALASTAHNGQEAVALLEDGTQVFDLILMDKEMPVMDGHQATQAIRKLGVTTPIIGVTGNAMDDQRKAFVEMGATRVVPKPITPTQLAALVDEFTTSWV